MADFKEVTLKKTDEGKYRLTYSFEDGRGGSETYDSFSEANEALIALENGEDDGRGLHQTETESSETAPTSVTPPEQGNAAASENQNS